METLKPVSENPIKHPPMRNLTLEDRRKILHEFNDTGWAYSKEETLISLFRKQVLLHPEKLAVKFREKQLTYGELDERSNQLAHYLIKKGVKPGTYIPIWLNRSIDWLVAVMGVLKAGAAYVPIDATYPLKRALYVASDTDALLIITNSAHGAEWEESTTTSVCYFDDLSVLDHLALPTHSPEIDVQQNALAYIIYTSGSTGNPKGVMVEHRTIQHLIGWHNQHFNVDETARLSLVAGLGFDISVWETWSALTAGAALFIADDDERMDAEALLDYYDRNKITHAYTPTVLTPAIIEKSRAKNDLSLKYLFTGGEQLKPVLTAGVSYELIDYYGPTECTVFATYRRVIDEDGRFVSSIGKPIANTRAYILDDQLEPLPIGAVGELCIGGEILAKGYLNNESLTDSKFIADPFFPSGKLYLTGDLARWLPNGEIQFLGRKDNQIKIRGFRVELGEVERALTNLQSIREAVVIVQNNSGNNKYLVGFTVPEKQGETVDIAEIRQQLKQELPGYMVPAQIISIESIPITKNGKMDRKRLQDLATEDKNETLVSEPPSNETEQIIADIWSTVLQRPIINVSDNFFDIGGDSLQVAVVVTAMMEKLKIKIYMRDIYQYPILKQLAQLLIARSNEEKKAIPSEDVEPVVELENDVYLTPDTTIAGGFDPELMVNPTTILLTGATGFVGIHLLQELLETTEATVYCLVRAQDEFHAMEKINECFERYRIPDNSRQRNRIIPVIGDLAKPFLGLCGERFAALSKAVDVIYHSGSSVNFIEPYSYMKAPNVDGLREIIRLAGAYRTKGLVLLSTISVYSWGHVFTHKTHMLETDDITQNLLAVSKDIGYVRSKWVMEAIADLAGKKGLPVITYRLGYAMCHSETGASAPYQWWAGLVKNCIEFQSYPLLKELREGLITVDYMTKAIAHISKNKDAIGRKFNLIAQPSTNLTLEEFFALLKQYYPFVLKGLPYKEWRKQWEDDKQNRLFPLTSLFKDNMHEGLSTVELYQDTYIWDCTNVIHFLEGSDIKEPVFDKKLLDAYLNYLGIPVG
ncbi:MAG: amino acid adenylation domain-containing protein [Olivibacter sp.]|nr:amino acid adenylation domain-containing protein [Olivibacter sp. UJ_SKK_5.1]